MSDNKKKTPHIFEMEIHSDPSCVMFSPESAAAAREQLTDAEREQFDSQLCIIEIEDGLSVLALYRPTSD